ncbi:hypothetical protein [uncultured Roseobacter sp.]|uniref:hypothetical protein n=1 Tax=uncultured Roseobacter sp. TaxID=114847 RepID=UPI002604F902|nr:hypothetical protein [uncultured Roseobacter sp.]
MRKFLALAMFSASLASTAALANPITVRSGDHDGFTRLVMQLPTGVEWDVSGVPGKQTISLSGHNSGFDLSRVFDVIPRDRLTNVVQYPARLELELSCDCRVNSFLEQGDFLVVDVIDGPPLTLEPATNEPSFVVLETESGFNFGELLWSEAIVDPRETVPNAKNQNTVENHANSLDPSASAIELEIVKDTRERLLKGLGEATSRGLLRAATPDLETLDIRQEPSETAEILDTSEQQAPEIEVQPGNMRVTSSRDVLDVEDGFDLTTSGAICASPKSVDVSGWGDNQPFHLQVSTLRQQLYSEVDRLDEGKAIALAQLYVFFGFGAEAKQVLRLSENLVIANPELMDLADIIEFGFARNPRSVHRFSDCDSDLALWAIMAAKTLPETQVINEQAALRALAKLPAHLRGFIAPALSNRLTQLGKLEAAAIALRRVEQGEDSDALDANLAKARIKQHSGETETSDQIFSEVAETNSKESPEALIAFVENRLIDFQPVPADISLLIEAYAFELQDAPIGIDLLRAHVVASALSGQFTKAIEVLNNNPISSNPGLQAELQSHVFSALAKIADDFEFLELTFAHFPEPANALQSQAVVGVSARVHQLGFHEEAADILASVPLDESTKPMRLLEAEILLSVGEPKNTIDKLQDLSGSMADELRARAYSALGENQRATGLFQANNMIEEASQSAWLSDDWIELTEGQEDFYSGVRALTQTPVDSIEAENGMITATQSALEESGAARGVLADLLGNVQVSP